MEKLKFTAYTDAKYRSKIGDDYTVLMDPDTLQFGKEIVYREDRQLGAIGGNTRFERYKPENLSFKITVDCTGIIEGTGDNDKVYNKIQKLEKLLYIYNSDGHRPSYVLIQYVELLFKGQIKKMDVKYTLFSNSGVPLRASVELTFTGFRCSEEERKKFHKQSPDMSRGNASLPVPQDLRGFPAGAAGGKVQQPEQFQKHTGRNGTPVSATKKGIEERGKYMADSPSKYAGRNLACKVFCNGKALGDAFELVSAHVRLELNRIGKATLRFNAGDMDKQTFDESDSDSFKPGTAIRIDAGELNDLKTLFDGIILDTGIRIGKGHRSLMTVECRDNAYAATQVRKNRIFEKKKDSDMIEEVLSAYGKVSADSTDYQHPDMVQYYCTDWDFALSRADACGMFILTTGSDIKAFKPTAGALPVLTVTYGNDLIDFDGGLSASDQFSGYDAVSWNPSEQKSVKESASVPKLNKQGDLEPENIAAADNMLLQTDAPADSKVLKVWADSMALKAGLARYHGSFSFYGAAEAVPGCIIELKGLGRRFGGNAFIGSVEHIIEHNEWITKAGIGINPGNITDEPDVVSPPAAGLLPGMEGLHTAVVKKLDGDPQKQYRIQVELPWMEGQDKLLWARLSTLYATNGSGSFWLPEPNDEVLVGFVNNNPANPVILGSIYGEKHKPPYEYEAENNKKALVTRQKMRIEFDEEKKIITVSTPGKNTVEISDDGKHIRLTDENKNEIMMDKNGITLSSAKDITLKAKGNITMDATMKISGTAKQDVSLEGLNVKVQAKVGATVKGNATAELSASGQTTVKGAMVMIN